MKSILLVIIASFLADQIFQPLSIIHNKHRSTWTMVSHVITWSISMFVVTMFFCMRVQNFELLNWFFLITIIHFMVDWCCCRMYTNLMYQGKRSRAMAWACVEQGMVHGGAAALFIHFYR